MTLDDADHKQRPADDFWAGLPTTTTMERHTDRLISLLVGAQRPIHCHQLGIDFTNIPHAQ